MNQVCPICERNADLKLKVENASERSKKKAS